MYPDDEQDAGLRDHCAHARFVWNLALEQANYYRPALGPTPNYNGQAAQLTEARRADDWLRSGSQTVQQQALRDLAQSFRNWWDNPRHFGRPTWRKKGIHEGFRIVGPQATRVEHLNRKWSRVLVPKVGWVRFRRSRPIPEWKSYRVTLDRSGRWHISFAVVPPMVAGPGTGEVVGIDRGVTHTLALSDGTLGSIPKPDTAKRRRLQRKMARQQPDSNRRAKTKQRLARLAAHEAAQRKDWVEKQTTGIARRFDIVKIEDLRTKQMMRSASGTVEEPGRNVAAKRGLNRSIASSCWGMFEQRLGHKIGDRLVRVPAVNTSRACHECGHVDQRNRESQAFRCIRCGHTAHADVNAAKNIAAGCAVTARGGERVHGPSDPAKREPPLGTVVVTHAA